MYKDRKETCQNSSAGLTHSVHTTEQPNSARRRLIFASITEDTILFTIPRSFRRTMVYYPISLQLVAFSALVLTVTPVLSAPFPPRINAAPHSDLDVRSADRPDKPTPKPLVFAFNDGAGRSSKEELRQVNSYTQMIRHRDARNMRAGRPSTHWSPGECNMNTEHEATTGMEQQSQDVSNCPPPLRASASESSLTRKPLITFIEHESGPGLPQETNRKIRIHLNKRNAQSRLGPAGQRINWEDRHANLEVNGERKEPVRSVRTGKKPVLSDQERWADEIISTMGEKGVMTSMYPLSETTDIITQSYSYADGSETETDSGLEDTSPPHTLSSRRRERSRKRAKSTPVPL